MTIAFPILDGGEIRLRPPRREDHTTIFAWYNDPEIVAPYDRFSVDTYDAFEESLAHAPDDPASLAPRFVIEQRSNGRVLGLVGYFRPHPVLEYLEVWYILGETRDRGKGIGTESVGLFVAHLFRTQAVERVGAVCDAENAPSYRLLDRLGFHRDGLFRSVLFHHGRWHDVLVYGVSRSEWAARSPPA